MSVVLVSIEKYEQELNEHVFTFTSTDLPSAVMAQQLDEEAYLQRTATKGGRQYRELYFKYMNRALASILGSQEVSRPPKDERRAGSRYFAYRGRTAMRDRAPGQTISLHDYKKALSSFNWNWAKTCQIDVYETGKARYNELEGIGRRLGGEYRDAWVAFAAQENNRSIA